MLRKGKKSVIQYWVSDCCKWPNLQRIALKLFYLSCTTAASERNFSTFGLVHTKTRNALLDEKVAKLVYIKTNSYGHSKEDTEDISLSDDEEENEGTSLEHVEAVSL